MMTQDDWKSFLDALMGAVNAAGYGASLHGAVSNYHGKPYNKKLNIWLVCGGCASSMYFAVDRLTKNDLLASARPPKASCPRCKHAGDHEYRGIQTG